MRSLRLCGFIVLMCLSRCLAQPAPATQPHNFDKWEKSITAFEEKDRANPPPKGVIVFTGASTITRWKTLEQDFPSQKILNRGFGGSEIVDCTHFADRIIFPYEPKMIFIRSGGNDIHAGKTAEQVFQDYKDFVAKVREKLPDTEIVCISLSPSIARWNEADANKALNAMIQKFSEQQPRLKYIDVYDIVLGPDGKPRPELFVEDKLHFTPAGYKLLTERVRPFLPR